MRSPLLWTLLCCYVAPSSASVRRLCLYPDYRTTLLLTRKRDTCHSTMAFSRWTLTDSRLSSLPLDGETDNYVRRHVPGVVFSLCSPTPLHGKLDLAAVSADALALLDLDPAEVVSDAAFVAFAAGNGDAGGGGAMAHRYGGHQFGSWAGQLGDGRAHLLGEYVNGRGERWELQLKGSGRTPYSRFGDGRAVLRSSVREFLCSESMFALGVPTSRAATLVVAPNHPVQRDEFYDGRVKMEKAAVVLRMAPTWFRFGSLEILSRNAELDPLRRLLRFVIAENYPHLVSAHPDDEDDRMLSLLAEVTEGTARMIARWMAVGFAHGVMNTDNFSLASVTIDYGPFGFLDAYDPHFIPNRSDDSGRYDFAHQPEIGRWNLERLAQAMQPVISPAKRSHLAKIVATFDDAYRTRLASLYRAKLGLARQKTREDDLRLASLLLDSMERTEADFTQTFRDLSETSLEDLMDRDKITSDSAWGLKRVRKDREFGAFLEAYSARLTEEAATTDEERIELMQKSNPRYVLRNWIAQRAIERAEAGDYDEVVKVSRVLREPFKMQVEAETAGYASPPPSWAKTISVSCSS